MVTIIQRTSENGDARLPRVPFAEPGTAPIDRLSALAFQGVADDLTPNVSNAEGGTTFTPGDGDIATYKIDANGVPSFGFDTSTSVGGKPALYIPSAGRPQIKTMLLVGRVLRLGSNPASGVDGYSMMMRQTAPGNGSLFLLSTTDSNPGVLTAQGNGVESRITGPLVEVGENSALHFFAVVFNGASSRLHYDSTVVSGTLSDPTSPGFMVGYGQSGINFEAIEAAQYSVALTVEQIAEKRAHYRALYQF